MEVALSILLALCYQPPVGIADMVKSILDLDASINLCFMEVQTSVS